MGYNTTVSHLPNPLVTQTGANWTAQVPDGDALEGDDSCTEDCLGDDAIDRGPEQYDEYD